MHLGHYVWTDSCRYLVSELWKITYYSVFVFQWPDYGVYVDKFVFPMHSFREVAINYIDQMKFYWPKQQNIFFLIYYVFSKEWLSKIAWDPT